jgi:hypothetical protein
VGGLAIALFFLFFCLHEFPSLIHLCRRFACSGQEDSIYNSECAAAGFEIPFVNWRAIGLDGNK